jgi:uncharacterized membrane protein YidH (DUF202 family)
VLGGPDNSGCSTVNLQAVDLLLVALMMLFVGIGHWLRSARQTPGSGTRRNRNWAVFAVALAAVLAARALIIALGIRFD